jgi:hypothetical protein
MKGRAGSCRSVGVARKSLKTLRRAGSRAGWVPVGLVVCKALKTLSVAVRAGACEWNPHTPIEPYRGRARARPWGPSVEIRVLGGERRPSNGPQPTRPRWNLKSPSNTRGAPQFRELPLRGFHDDDD